MTRCNQPRVLSLVPPPAGAINLVFSALLEVEDDEEWLKHTAQEP